MSIGLAALHSGLGAGLYGGGGVRVRPVGRGELLTPKLIGDRIHLHPVWVIFALFAGGTLLGFIGVLIAVPAAAVIGVLIRFALQRYRQSALYNSQRACAGTGAAPRPGSDDPAGDRMAARCGARQGGFLVSDCNRAALGWVERWPRLAGARARRPWPARQRQEPPRACLARAQRREAGRAGRTDRRFGAGDRSRRAPRLPVDDADHVPERDLLHLYNWCGETRPCVC